MKSLLLALFAIWIALLAPLRAQTLEFQSLYDTHAEISQTVHQVYEDGKGYVWLATSYGVYRYDGDALRGWKSDLQHPNLLPNNNVLCVGDDGHNNLWVGTHGGLCRLDPQHDTLKHYALTCVDRHRLNCMARTADGTSYFGYIRGLVYYDEAGDSVVMLTRQNSKGDVAEVANVQSLVVLPNQELLLATWNKGLYRYLPGEHRFVHYEWPDKRTPNFRAMCVAPDSVAPDTLGGRYSCWLGTSDNGLYKVLLGREGEIVLQQHVVEETGGLSSNFIDYLYPQPDRGELWVASRRGLDVVKGDAWVQQMDTIEVNSLLRDRCGQYWVGTQNHGVYYSALQPKLFEHRSLPDPMANFMQESPVSDLCVLPDGSMWLGWEHGAAYVAADGSSHLLYDDKCTQSITWDSVEQCALLCVQDEGLTVCREGEVLGHYISNNCDFVADGLVYAAARDVKHRLWVASYKGLGVSYPDGRAYTFRDLEHVPPILKNEVRLLLCEGDTALWVASASEGVAHITGNLDHPEEMQARVYSKELNNMPVNAVRCLFKDAHGRLWLGTEGSGLCLFDAEALQFVSMHQSLGLPGDVVSRIAQDDHGDLWLSTPRGVVRMSLKPDSVGIRVFSKIQGLDDASVMVPAVGPLSDSLYWGCKHGVVMCIADSLLARIPSIWNRLDVAFTPNTADANAGGVWRYWGWFVCVLLLLGAWYLYLMRRQHSAKAMPLPDYRNMGAMGPEYNAKVTIDGRNEADVKFLNDAEACVRRHMEDQNFDVTCFLEEMNMSRTSLFNKLKEQTGMNTTAFIRTIRLQEACKILQQEPEVRVSELAYRVGYNDPKYFSTCFKKQYGMLPSEYVSKLIVKNET